MSKWVSIHPRMHTRCAHWLLKFTSCRLEFNIAIANDLGVPMTYFRLSRLAQLIAFWSLHPHQGLSLIWTKRTLFCKNVKK